MKVNKKICIFSSQYLPHVGGVERYTFNISKELERKGYEIAIITSRTKGLLSYEEDGKIRIYRLPCFQWLKGRYPVLRYNKETRKILRELEEDDYDLVITNTRFYLLSLTGVMFGKKCAKNSIVIEHGTAHLTIHQPFWDMLGRCFEHTITFAIKHFCKRFYGVSEACNEWLLHFNIHAESVLYNSIDLDLIKRNRNNGKFDRNKFHISENCKIISFAGRLVKEKGVLQLARAFEKIQKKYKDIYLVIAGGGELLEELEKMNIDHMLILGQVDYEMVISVLYNSNIFCLPSDSEGMPTTVLEAIACRSFVITTERGGAREIITDDTFGIIMKNNDENTIEKSFDRVLQSPKYMKIAVEKSYERLIESFTSVKVAEKIEDIFLKN